MRYVLFTILKQKEMNTMSVAVHDLLIMDSPQQAIDRVLEELELHPSEDEVRLTGAEVMEHLETLRIGFGHFSCEQLPSAFAKMARTVSRRGSNCSFHRSKFMEQLVLHRMRLEREEFALS